MDEYQFERSDLHIAGKYLLNLVGLVLFLVYYWITVHVFLAQDGDKFWRMPECYIRGSTIKYLRIPDEVIDMVKEETMVKGRGRGEMRGRGGQAQRGRGGGRGKKCSLVQYIV